MRASFFEGWIDNTGSIILSDTSEEELVELEHTFILALMTTPAGHQSPTYALRHSDEPDDCSRKEFNGLVRKYQATVI